MRDLKSICSCQSAVPLRNWIQSLGDFSKGFRIAFSSNEVTLDGTTLAVDLYHMLGWPNGLSNDVKSQIKSILDQYQTDFFGFFAEKDWRNRIDDSIHPRVHEMHANYATFQAAGAYEAAGVVPNKRVSFYDSHIDRGIKSYLDGFCPWDRSPWGAGGMVDNLATILWLNIRMGYGEYASVLEEVFDWVRVSQNPETGLWGSPEAQGLSGQINGAYHLLRGTLAKHGLPIPMARNIIDAILLNLKKEPLLQRNRAHGCYDLDHFHLLQKCVESSHGYRIGEARDASVKRWRELKALVHRNDGAFSFHEDRSATIHNYYTVSPGKKESDLQGTVFYLQTFISIAAIVGVDFEHRPSLTHG